MASAVYNIKPEDGWVQVTAADVSFIRIRSTANHGFFVECSATQPAATTLGYYCNSDGDTDDDFFSTTGVAGSFFWVRTSEGRPSGSKIYVFSLLGNTATPLSTGAATEATLAAMSAKLPAALGAGGGVKIDGSGTALPATLKNKQTFSPGATSYIAIGLELSGYATPTDLFSLVNPAGSGKVLQARLFIVSFQSTTATLSKLRWFKRASLNTGGSPTLITPAKYDSTDPAPVGVVQAYTAAPTIVDSTAPLLAYQQALSAATTAAPANTSLSAVAANATNIGIDMAEPVTLRAGEELTFNFNGVALPLGTVMTPIIQWTEQ